MSIGPIYGYTGNYKFTLIEYDFPRWQSYEHDNWRNLDAVLGTLFGTFGLGGVWKNGVTYNVNERIIDADENVLYLCLASNTSIATGTFGQDRELNPTNWRSLSFSPANRGNWSANTQYNIQDIVISGSQIAICKLAHLSSTSFYNDVNTGYWSVLIDVTGYNIGLSLTRNNNLSDLVSASSARTNLGLGSAAQNNTGDFFQINNNLSDGNPVAIAASLGLKSGAFQDTSSYLVGANNLKDVSNIGNARTNLGLGSLATASAITSGQISDAGNSGIALIKAQTPADVTVNVNPFSGDTGVGGTKGLVPAPGKGDAAANRFLHAGGSFVTPDVPTLLGYTPVQQGGGPNQNAAFKINIGWSGTTLNASVNGADQGSIFATYNCPLVPNGTGFQALGSGLVLQWTRMTTDGNGFVTWSGFQPITTLLSVQATIDNNGGSGTPATPPYVQSKSNTSITIKCSASTSLYISTIGVK